MHISRLFEIVYILINKKFTTAKELANYFEVSQRTIYRDIETLNVAGIPVYTNKGKGGGIKLLESFRFNKSMLSEQEQNEILIALQSFRALKQSNLLNSNPNPPNLANNTEAESLLTKLSAIFNRDVVNWVEIDFSDWSFTGKDNFNVIKSSILNQNCVAFDYFNSKGEKTHRIIQPITVWFKHRSWYVKAFCLIRQGYRVFKLSRIKNIAVVTDKFEILKLTDAPPVGDSYNAETRTAQNFVNLKLRINASMAYRVYDEFNEDNIESDVDGNFIIRATYPENEWLYGYVLSFNRNAEVLEPLYFRDAVRLRVREMLDKYE